MISTPDLIDKLSTGVSPIRRLLPPAFRAALWLGAIIVIAGAAIFAWSDLPTVARRAARFDRAIELFAMLATGIGAVLAAFMLSVPGRSSRWLFLPLVPLVVWLASSGAQCLHTLEAFGAQGWTRNAGSDCFKFIALAGTPVTFSLLALLARAKPIAPVPVAVMAALGAGSLTAFVLQFFHPIDASFLDLAIHLAAVALLAGLAAFAGRIARARWERELSGR